MKALVLIFAFLISHAAFASNVTVGSVSETPILFGAAAVDVNGNSVYNYNENVLLYFKNTSGVSGASVIITAQQTSQYVPGFGNVTKSNIVQSVAAGAEYIVGPFSATGFNNSNQQIIITYGGAAASSLNISAFQAPKLLKMP